MDGRVMSTVAPGRAETGRAPQQFGPDLGNASGRIAVTKADKEVAPAAAGAAPVVTSTSANGSTAVVEAPGHTLVRRRLSEYLDDTLDDGLRQRIDEHLRACRDCTRYVKTLRATVDVVQQLPHPKAPPAGIARVLEQARRESEWDGPEATDRPDA
jgi:hypothetical protein